MKKVRIAAVCMVLTVAAVYTAAYALPNVHTVKKGETMSGIARQYGVDLNELQAENPQVKNPALIYPGQELNIPSGQEDYSALEDEALRILNRERVKRGLQPLMKNEQLSKCARAKAKDMADNDYLSHTSPSFGSSFAMMEKAGLSFSAATENLAKGLNTPLELMTVWMNSIGHRNNLLSPVYTQTGIGIAVDSMGNYRWAQLFIKPIS